MYLEKIDIQGFKSFAQQTTLSFNKELTAIVGPNGSGKSNVADAIRWVLGEQSLKLLRGKKSEDVIFSGSDKKSRLGFARITIYLNNSDRKADIDYDQIVIVRSIDRHGESEYMLNNSKVRLTDIQLLLAKASVGQKSYSVIGQGMIDSLLTLSSNERRDFFDEATGVRQFQMKKSQALHKLEQTDANLEQAELVLQEISPRLRTLSRQVKRLERKEDLEQQLLESQNNYYSYLMGKLEHQLTKVTDKVGSEQATLDDFSQQQKEIQKKLDDHDREQGRGDAYDVLQKKLFNAQQEYNTSTKKKIVIEGEADIDQIKQGNVERVRLNQRLNELTNRKNKLSTDAQELEQHIQSAQSVIDRLEKNAEKSANQLHTIEQELSHPASADLTSVEDTAHKLHDEHELLLEFIDTVSSPEEIGAFKERFKQFAVKLKVFLHTLRGKKSAGHEKRWHEYTQLNAQYKELDRELRKEELTLGRKQHEHDVVKERIVELTKEEKEIQGQLQNDTRDRQQRLSQDIDALNQELTEKEKQIISLRRDIDTFNEHEEEKKKELVDLQKKFRTLQYDFTIKNNELTTLKVELAKLETKKEDLEKEIAQEAPRFTKNETGHVNEDETREQIETLKRQLNIIGGIDTETLQEYTEVKEKHDFLTQQTTDLRGAQKSLIKLITELDEHITKQFQYSFKNINTLFSKYFKRLFNGGHAKLVLNILADDESEKEVNADSEDSEEDETDEDIKKAAKTKEKNPLKKLKTKHFDYTIDIHATPPGKKLASINMLSGGEKALTAIALVSSIIANNPPPFVVLDEVDAALDEANSIRFAEIVSELMDKSQFITITHNRATMHQAKILYGVTMGDDGISRLLSVNFEEANKISA